MTADLFNVKSLDGFFAVFDSSFETSFILTNDRNIFVGEISRFSDCEDDNVLQ